MQVFASKLLCVQESVVPGLGHDGEFQTVLRNDLGLFGYPKGARRSDAAFWGPTHGWVCGIFQDKVHNRLLHTQEVVFADLILDLLEKLRIRTRLKASIKAIS